MSAILQVIYMKEWHSIKYDNWGNTASKMMYSHCLDLHYLTAKISLQIEFSHHVLLISIYSSFYLAASVRVEDALK